MNTNDLAQNGGHILTVLERANVTEALLDAGLDEDSLYEGYSGRGMYGATCFGITGSTGDASMFLIALAGRIGSEDAMDLARTQATDSLGLDVISYYPRATVREEVTT